MLAMKETLIGLLALFFFCGFNGCDPGMSKIIRDKGNELLLLY